MVTKEARKVKASVAVPVVLLIGGRSYALIKGDSSKTGNWEYYELGSWGNFKQGVPGEGLVRVKVGIDADLYAEIREEMDEAASVS